MRMTIDLNCDLGEAEDRARQDVEARVMASVSSVNLACGVHAGGPDLMRRMVRRAMAAGVAVGAHPGFRDQVGMGRRPRRASAPEVENLVAYQIGALAAIAAMEGARLGHVKPHGALYTMAARDRTLATAIARAVRAVDPRLVLVGLAGSISVETARELGLRAAAEAFADRGYEADGHLVPRGYPGALIEEEDQVVARVVSLVRDQTVPDTHGRLLTIAADTICLHGDTPGADRLAGAIRRALEGQGIRIQALTHHDG